MGEKWQRECKLSYYFLQNALSRELYELRFIYIKLYLFKHLWRISFRHFSSCNVLKHTFEFSLIFNNEVLDAIPFFIREVFTLSFGVDLFLYYNYGVHELFCEHIWNYDFKKCQSLFFYWTQINFFISTTDSFFFYFLSLYCQAQIVLDNFFDILKIWFV